MNEVECHAFNWQGLLMRVKEGKVIPVIGHQLYRDKNDTGEKDSNLLYDYLARELLKECRMKPPAHEHLSFAKAASAFLKENNNNSLKLSETLKKKLDVIHFIPGNPLWKLSRIKPFNLYITTAYDDFLANILKTVRDIEVKTFGYAQNQKEFKPQDDDLSNSLDNRHCPMVYHLFGSIGKQKFPAYTEKDTHEILRGFIEDMNRHRENNLFKKLKSSDLLFMGFHSEYDSLFFSTLIPALQNKLPHPSPDFSSSVFIGGISHGDNKNFPQLVDFLESYNAGIICTCESEGFVDCLFRNLREYDDQLIIPGTEIEDDGIPACSKRKSSEENIPVAFISFRRDDRKAAERLASNLKSDGINVWYDDFELEPGDEVHETIILEAIAKYAVFIPLISRASKKLVGSNDVRFHYREWQRAIDNHLEKKNPLKIMPVRIDETDWIYDGFRNFYHIKITGGKKVGKYKLLRKKLLDIRECISKGLPITNDKC